MPGACCTRGLVCNVGRSAHTSIQVQPGHAGIPCAVVLRLIPRSPWRRIPFASIAGGLKAWRNPVGFLKTSAGLTPATGARTTRLCRPRTSRSSARGPRSQAKSPPCENLLARPRCRGHRSPHPTSVTIAIRPSCGRGMAGVVGVIWGKREAEYFSREGWTRLRARRKVICPSGSHRRRHTVMCTYATAFFPSPLVGEGAFTK
ncbi:hypothetical protein V1288_002717 [Bradyrhizobium sp. AZCC 2176]